MTRDGDEEAQMRSERNGGAAGEERDRVKVVAEVV